MAGARRHARPDRGAVRGRHPGDLRLEPGQRPAPGHRQARAGRARLHPHHVRRLRLAAALPADGHPRPAGRARPAQPGQRVGVRPAHRRRQERLRADSRDRCTTTCLERPRSRSCTTRSGRRPTPPWPRRASPPDQRRFVRTADLRYFGQAFEVRVPVPRRTARSRGRSTRWPRPSTPSTAPLYGYDFRGDPSQQVEWVNLRVTGIGPIRRPDILAQPPGEPRGAVGVRRRPVCFDAAEGYVETPVLWRPDLAVGHRGHRTGRRRGVRLDGAAAPRLHRPGRRLRQPRRHPRRARRMTGPTAAPSPAGSRCAPTRFPFGHLTDDVGRGADPVLRGDRRRARWPASSRRSRRPSRAPRAVPMIRDAHDFRAGIHDRLLRKLTGRSYSRAGAPGRPRLPAGDDAAGRRLLPQRRLPVRGRHRPPAGPVRHRAGVPRRARSVAFVQAFGHHDDIGGARARLDAQRTPPACSRRG